MKRLGSVLKNGPVEIHQIPALTDNYIYVFRDEAKKFTAVVDPSEAQPVIDYCTKRQWHLDRVLNTHHHPDHTGGNVELNKKYDCPVFALKDDAHRIAGVTDYFEKDQTTALAGHAMTSLFTPGHTVGHVCLHFPELKFLFCGDTLFSFGCGRLFEGDPAMMLKTLRTLRALPADTNFFCGHEYTVNNIRFAISLEPDNKSLQAMLLEMQSLREQDLPTVPALLQREMALSPFLRWDDPALKKALKMEGASDLEVFTEVRTRRNSW